MQENKGFKFFIGHCILSSVVILSILYCLFAMIKTSTGKSFDPSSMATESIIASNTIENTLPSITISPTMPSTVPLTEVTQAPDKDVEVTESTFSALQDQLVSLGVFKLTAYCPCYECSRGYGDSTATGVKAKPNHTIAVDPKVISYGTKIYINGTIYTAEDCGGSVKGKTIDIYFKTHKETINFGVQYAEVYIVEDAV